MCSKAIFEESCIKENLINLKEDEYQLGNQIYVVLCRNSSKDETPQQVAGKWFEEDHSWNLWRFTTNREHVERQISKTKSSQTLFLWKQWKLHLFYVPFETVFFFLCDGSKENHKDDPEKIIHLMSFILECRQSWFWGSQFIFGSCCGPDVSQSVLCLVSVR